VWILPVFKPTLSSVYVKHNWDTHVSIVPLRDDETDKMIESIGDLKLVIRENIISNDEWRKAYKKWITNKDVDLKNVEILVERFDTDGDYKFVECGNGESVIDPYIRENVELNGFECCPFLFDFKIKSSVEICIIRDYMKGSILKKEVCEDATIKNILDYVRNEDKWPETEKFTLVYEGKIVKDMNIWISCCLGNLLKRFVYIFKYTISDCDKTDNLLKRTNVFIISKNDCFCMKCDIKDTFKTLINKIYKRFKIDKSRILLFMKTKYYKYNKNMRIW
jgi:hypothetical protein